MWVGPKDSLRKTEVDRRVWSRSGRGAVWLGTLSMWQV